MKNVNFFLIVFLLVIVQSVNAQTEINRTLYFDVDQHTLTAPSEASLLNLVGLLSECRESNIEIVGHTDQQGSLEYNMELSKKRALAVKQFVVNAGYPSTEIKVNFLGESDLLSSATDKRSLEANRRVSVVANKFDYETITDFVSYLKPNNDTKANVDNSRGAEVNLAQGTLVKIPSDAFCNMDGSALKGNNVEMTFKEAFDYTQMLDDRLFTQTADRILETGGMIHIAASQNGKPVRLKEGKKIELLFPEQKSKGGMELFTGVTDDNGVTWDETGEEITEQKEDYFIQVDFSPILDFKFEFADTISIPEEAMTRYPKVPRMPHPPSKTRYTEVKYTEVYSKYEVSLAQYKIDLSERPAKLEAWNEEVNRRKRILYDHKQNHVSGYVKKWVAFQIEKLAEKSESISHHKLIRGLESFLNKKVGDADYNYLENRNKIFKGSLMEVLDNHEVLSFNYSDKVIGDYSSEIYQAINEVNGKIVAKKMEMGIMDFDVSRYVVSTSNLGWINCDRFYDVADADKMNFQFARESEDHEYYLIFKGIKSMIRPSFRDGKVRFDNLPIGEDVRLVSVGVNESEFYVASQDLKLSQDVRLNLDFKKAKLQDLRNVLEGV